MGPMIDGMEIFISKREPGLETQSGKFRVTVISAWGDGSTKDYDDISSAIKALTDRGASNFSPCRRPGEL